MAGLVAKAKIEPLRERLAELFLQGSITKAQLAQAGQSLKNSELVYLQQQVRRAKKENDFKYFNKEINRQEWLRLNHLQDARLVPCALCGTSLCPYTRG